MTAPEEALSRSSSKPDRAVVQTAWARLLMASLHRAGLRHAIISPGSRSTPFVLAAEHAGLVTHTVIDERSAGFFALGCARESGIPPVLLCTSGTAGAHYYPAVIEASQSFVPLLVITADRPPALRGCGAPQTIDQTELYGSFVRLFFDLGPADPAPASLRALARKAGQAVARSLGPIPGPVHINAPATKPLEPAPPRTAADAAVVKLADDIAARRASRIAVAPHAIAEDILIELADACLGAKRGLMAAGPMYPPSARQRQELRDAARSLAHATGFPALYEASSQLRFSPAGDGAIDGFDLLLASPEFRRRNRPDLIIQVGTPLTSMSWQHYMVENPDCIHWSIAEHGWNDPHSSVNVSVAAPPAMALAELARVVEYRSRSRSRSGEYDGASEGEKSRWAEHFRTGNGTVWRCVEGIMRGSDGAPMREGQAMRAIVDALPDGALLALGNSLPIRTVDTYCRASARCIDVMTQRGANGIDGLISSAAGAALVRDSGPTVLILGDVSFAHDVGGLAAARRVRGPLVIVVIDNGGGRIFELLPIAQQPSGPGEDVFAAHWLTPPDCDIAKATAAHGHRSVLARSPEGLAAATRAAMLEDGCTVIRAVIEPSSAADDRRRMIASLDSSCTGESA